MEKNYQDLFRDIVTIIRRDYAGATLLGDRFRPRYYNQAIGQAWTEGRLDDLLFLRYISQMLACTGDRHLRLSLRPSGSYTPSSPGFFTRRYGDSLCITHVTGDSRLSPGDRIIALNGGSVSDQRRLFQQNFLYSDIPEREDWNGVLKMADTITVLSQDGRETLLPAEKHSLCPPALTEELKVLAGNVLYCRPGVFDGGAGALAESAASLMNADTAFILDLRNARGDCEEDIYPFLPLICKTDTPLSALLDTRLSVSYTRLNCILKAACLQNVPGADIYIDDLKRRSGAGIVTEEDESAETIRGLAPRRVVVLTDTWCRDAGETLVLAAKRAGAHLVGRPTLGTADFCGDVSLELNERFVLTWPTAVAARVFDGESYTLTGIAPDELISWTPDELENDLLLDAATAYINNP